MKKMTFNENFRLIYFDFNYFKKLVAKNHGIEEKGVQLDLSKASKKYINENIFMLKLNKLYLNSFNLGSSHLLIL